MTDTSVLWDQLYAVPVERMRQQEAEMDAEEAAEREEFEQARSFVTHQSFDKFIRALRGLAQANRAKKGEDGFIYQTGVRDGLEMAASEMEKLKELVEVGR